MFETVRFYRHIQFKKLISSAVKASSSGNFDSQQPDMQNLQSKQLDINKVKTLTHPNSNRLFVTDKKSGKVFLIDTGADVSVLPSTRAHRTNGSDTDNPLFAANGTVINTYGVIRLELDLGLRRPFVWSFTIADTDKPIIGADFLRQYHRRHQKRETHRFTNIIVLQLHL